MSNAHEIKVKEPLILLVNCKEYSVKPSLKGPYEIEACRGCNTL